MRRQGLKKRIMKEAVELLACAAITAFFFCLCLVQCKADDKVEEAPVVVEPPVIWTVAMEKPVEVVKPEPVVEVEVEPVVEAVEIYDVPLETELQMYIMDICESEGIEPAVIFAMAEKESNFNADAVGDGGAAIGMFQVQPRWHQERMDNLGVTDLFNPYQNAAVAIDFLAELIDYYDGDVEKAVVAYNMGQTGAYNNCFSKGIYSSSYSRGVMERCQDLKESRLCLDNIMEG